MRCQYRSKMKQVWHEAASRGLPNGIREMGDWFVVRMRVWKYSTVLQGFCERARSNENRQAMLQESARAVRTISVSSDFSLLSEASGCVVAFMVTTKTFNTFRRWTYESSA